MNDDPDGLREDIRQTYRDLTEAGPDKIDAAICTLREAKRIVRDPELMASIRERLAQNKAAVDDQAGGKEQVA